MLYVGPVPTPESLPGRRGGTLPRRIGCSRSASGTSRFAGSTGCFRLPVGILCAGGRHGVNQVERCLAPREVRGKRWRVCQVGFADLDTRVRARIPARELLRRADQAANNTYPSSSRRGARRPPIYPVAPAIATRCPLTGTGRFILCPERRAGRRRQTVRRCAGPGSRRSVPRHAEP